MVVTDHAAVNIDVITGSIRRSCGQGPAQGLIRYHLGSIFREHQHGGQRGISVREDKLDAVDGSSPFITRGRRIVRIRIYIIIAESYARVGPAGKRSPGHSGILGSILINRDKQVISIVVIEGILQGDLHPVVA